MVAAGSQLTIEGLAIRDTSGIGVLIDNGATSEIRGTLVDGSMGMGVFVFAATAVLADGVLVRETAPEVDGSLATASL